jgi:hypothetical protein
LELLESRKQLKEEGRDEGR